MRIQSLVLVVIVAAALSACGGGGGGGSGSSSSGGSGSGTLTVSTQNLTFIANGPNAPTPDPQLISGSVTGFSSGTLNLLIVGSGQAVASIESVQITGQTGSTYVHVPSPASLGVGTYTGTITVRACRNDPQCVQGNLSGSPQTIQVTYHVAELRSSVAEVAHTLTNNNAATAISNVTITGTPAQAWTATEGADWLTVAAAGNTGGTLNPALVQNVVAGMNNGVYTTEVTVTPGTGGVAIHIPVTLNIRRTQVDQVSPYVAYTGTSHSVIIRAQELQQVTVLGVTFGGNPATAFTVVSGTEIRATYPPGLAPGRFPVRLQTGFADLKHFADLVVVDPPQFAAAVLPYHGTDTASPFAIIYDAERASIGVVAMAPFAGGTALVHFKSVNNVWQPATATPFLNSFGLALTADGREWIVGAYRDVAHVDPVSLATNATTTSLIFGSSTLIVDDMATSNDGSIAIFGDVDYNCGSILMLYDPRARIFREPTPRYDGCRGTVGASGDGSRLLVLNAFDVFGTDDVLALDTSASTTAATGAHVLTRHAPRMDLTGSRMVLNMTRVYDGSYALLGQLPASTLASVVSPDGARAYTYDVSGKMRTFDLQAPASGGSMSEIGTGTTLAGDPGTGSPFLQADVPFRMAITPDGSAVFIAGSLGVVVQPTP